MNSDGPRDQRAHPDFATRNQAANQLYVLLLKEISHMQAGYRLPSEREIAEEFSVSRQTARRALKRLADERLIERRQGSGSYVLHHGSDGVNSRTGTPDAGIIDVIELRRILDPYVTELATARATREDISKLEQCHLRMTKAEEQDVYKQAGFRFLLQLAICTRNPLLIESYRMLVSSREAIGWNQLRSMSDTRELREKLVERNRSLLDAIINRDRQKAVALTREILEDTMEAALGPPSAAAPSSLPSAAFTASAIDTDSSADESDKDRISSRAEDGMAPDHSEKS